MSEKMPYIRHAFLCYKYSSMPCISFENPHKFRIVEYLVKSLTPLLGYEILAQCTPMPLFPTRAVFEMLF